LQGAIALITGGASGIGFACARWMAERGCRVVIADRDTGSADAAAQAVSGLACTVDIRDSELVEAVVAGVEERVGGIGILVNCAGVLQNPLPPGQLAMKEWDLVTSVDLRGTYVMCAAVGPRMATRRCGSIVNIGSVAALRSSPLHAYGPAKAAVIALTESLAVEWGRSGVRVNTVSPGFTRTPAVAKSLERGILNEEVITGATALGRFVDPTEIAAAVGFLASPLASAITGVNLTVDAGYLVATSWQACGGLPSASR
jgi:NAD(P)-dependent dehydrogenase (short-subunit alcohol dehydrogenase family)